MLSRIKIKNLFSISSSEPLDINFTAKYTRSDQRNISNQIIWNGENTYISIPTFLGGSSNKHNSILSAIELMETLTINANLPFYHNKYKYTSMYLEILSKTFGKFLSSFNVPSENIENNGSDLPYTYEESEMPINNEQTVFLVEKEYLDQRIKYLKQSMNSEMALFLRKMFKNDFNFANLDLEKFQASEINLIEWLNAWVTDNIFIIIEHLTITIDEDLQEWTNSISNNVNENGELLFEFISGKSFHIEIMPGMKAFKIDNQVINSKYIIENMNLVNYLENKVISTYEDWNETKKIFNTIYRIFNPIKNNWLKGRSVLYRNLIKIQKFDANLILPILKLTHKNIDAIKWNGHGDVKYLDSNNDTHTINISDNDRENSLLKFITSAIVKCIEGGVFTFKWNDFSSDIDYSALKLLVKIFSSEKINAKKSQLFLFLNNPLLLEKGILKYHNALIYMNGNYRTIWTMENIKSRPENYEVMFSSRNFFNQKWWELHGLKTPLTIDDSNTDEIVDID